MYACHKELLFKYCESIKMWEKFTTNQKLINFHYLKLFNNNYLMQLNKILHLNKISTWIASY